MNLYLVRHARPLAGSDDTPLSPEGQEQAAKLAALFVRVDPPRESLTILASTLQRARQTAVAIAQELEVAVADIATFPAPGDEVDFVDRLLLRLQALAAAGKTDVIVVGHSNYVPQTAAKLLGAPAASFLSGFVYAASACLVCNNNFSPASASLRWLVLSELLPESSSQPE